MPCAQPHSFQPGPRSVLGGRHGIDDSLAELARLRTKIASSSASLPPPLLRGTTLRFLDREKRYCADLDRLVTSIQGAHIPLPPISPRKMASGYDAGACSRPLTAGGMMA